jgi:Fe-S-cluster containining protein
MILQSLSYLYDRIDARVNHLSIIHIDRLHCGPGCSDCCIDGITVNEVEALNIRHHYSDLLSKTSPHPEGACAFLANDHTCRIYDKRPYVCRTQGLPLHWIEERDGKTIAFRDICPHNDNGIPVEQLPEDQCWKIGPVEEELARLQNILTSGIIKRVKLRDLFTFDFLKKST